MATNQFFPRDIQFGNDGIFLRSILSGQTIDIYPIIVEFNVYENIMRSQIEAEIIVHDTLSLQSVFPLIGEEEVEIHFRTPTGDDDREFSKYNLRITGITNFRKGATDRSELLLITATSKEALKDKQTRLQVSFKPSPGDQQSGLISTWVDIILKEELESEKDLDIEETLTPQQFVIPNLTPFDTIRMLMKYADSKEFPEISDYLFWEDHKGFHFKTVQMIMKEHIDGQASELEGMTAGMPIENYVELYQPTRRETEGYADEIYYDSQQNLPREITGSQLSPYTGTHIDYLKMIKYEFNTVIDLDSMIRNGMFDNKVQYINPIDMQFEENIFQYHKDHSKFYPINRNGDWNIISPDTSEIASKEGISHIRIMHHDPYHMGGVGGIPFYPQVRKDFMHNAVGSFAMLSGPILTITIPGDNLRRPGDIVEVALSELGATDDIINENHRFFDGYYLVLAVRHIYSGRDSYTTVLELAKNSLNNSIMNRNREGGLDGLATQQEVEQLLDDPNVQRQIGILPQGQQIT